MKPARRSGNSDGLYLPGLTGQRIRKTLENLQLIENKISSSGTLDELGIEVKVDPMSGGVRESTENHVHSQADIDALFA